MCLKIRTSKNMQNMRHFGRQSSQRSAKMAHSAVHNSNKRNNVLPETNISKDILSSTELSEIDHGKAGKELISNISVHFKDCQQRCICTAQKDTIIPLRVLDNNVERWEQVKVQRVQNKQSRRLLDRPISEINVSKQTNSKHFVVKHKFQDHKKVSFFYKAFT